MNAKPDLKSINTLLSLHVDNTPQESRQKITLGIIFAPTPLTVMGGASTSHLFLISYIHMSVCVGMKQWRVVAVARRRRSNEWLSHPGDTARSCDLELAS